MSGSRLAAALEEAFFEPSKHPRARGGKFADVLGKAHVVPTGAYGPMSRSSFGSNLHRIKLDAGGGEHYSFDRRPNGIWHHTFTSGMGGTSFVNPSVPLSPAESKKLDTIDLAAAKTDIAATKDPERKSRLEAHVKGGYFTGPSALKGPRRTPDGSGRKSASDLTPYERVAVSSSFVSQEDRAAFLKDYPELAHITRADIASGRNSGGQPGRDEIRAGHPGPGWAARAMTDQQKEKAFRDYTTGRRKKLPDGSDPLGAVIPEKLRRGQGHLFQTWPYVDAATD